jgi:outer membrane protein OmpA-like peptidoglycan-associated protein/uncharacterized protein YidB (DUF937 family)
MGVLDGVLNEAQNRFGMTEGSASSLTSGLLAYINEQRTGLRGLLDRFRQAGMGDSVSSWLSGTPEPISAENLESVLGSNTISAIASKTSLSVPIASSVLAFMFPKIVQRLAPGGVAPTHLPSEFMAYISGPTAAIASGARQVVYSGERAPHRPSALWPILGIVLLTLLGFWIWNSRRVAQSKVFNAAEQVRLAIQSADTALASLKPGFSPQDLTDALNLGIINFASGSAELPADGRDFLNRAATAIKMAPQGTTIEIDGHTDNTGDAVSNLQLSQRRAEAVRDYLTNQGVDPSVLTTKGYGESKPVATNDTAEGRFRNRRIEFVLVQQAP